MIRSSVLLLFGLAATFAAFGQTSQITGQVSDPSGASVPAAAVVVANTGTGIKNTTRTNAEGYFTVPFLDPGYYDISVTMSGFKTATRSGIKLDLAQVARIDFRLDVGAQSDQVVVTSAAPLVQSETASQGQVIGEAAMVDLPLNGRNFTQLTTLTPGAYTGAQTNFTKGSTVTANGMRNSNTAYVVNGINTTDQDFEGTAILPPPDAIQEFKVQTNNLGAQHGLGGAVISLELKSGTNALHGVLYEFLRNDKLDARNFFAQSAPSLKQNQFGFAVGGPVIKDRTFFFGDYQGTRVRNGQTFNSVVATAAMKQGDFAGQKTIKDPLSGAAFPDSRIPSNRISPQSSFFLPFFPLPNSAQGTFVRTANGRSDSDQFDIRMDHQIRNGDNLKVTYMFSQPAVFVPGTFPENGAVTTSLRHQSAGISETHIFGPSVVNEFTIGFLRLRSFGEQQGLGTNYTVQSGIGGFEMTSGTFPGFPTLTPTGFAGLTNNAFQPLRFRENNYNVRDLITIVRGKHVVEAGADLTAHSNFTTNSANSRGTFTFNGTYTGNAYADFLLGIPFQGGRSFPRDLFGYYTRQFEPFVQDSWKVTPRLTLNFGVRYSYFFRPWAMHNVLSSVDPAANRIVVASAADGTIRTEAQQVAKYVFPLFSDIIVPSSKLGMDSSLRDSHKKNFAPRIGMAWQPGMGFVLRAGYGILYSRTQGVQYEGTVAGANLPFFADQLGVFNTTPAPTKTLANFFPPIAVGAFTLPPGTFYQLDPASQIPYFQQWNFAVQKVLGGVVSAEGAYVGNKGTHLAWSRPVNVPLPGAGAIQTRRMNQRFSAGNLIEQADSSIYHAFQGKFETRRWRGANLLGTFTWAKSLDYQPSDSQVSPVQDPYNMRAERGPVGQPAARFTLSAVYQLPFFRHGSGFVSRVLGGWEMTSIFIAQSGSAFTPAISTDPANTGTSKRPNRIGNGALADRSIDQWFDVSAFQVPAPFTYGNSGVNILRGPSRTNWDFGLFKEFGLKRLSEASRVQFRSEYFNITNTPKFGNPNANIQAPAAGKILSADGPRVLQFALKLLF